MLFFFLFLFCWKLCLWFFFIFFMYCCKLFCVFYLHFVLVLLRKKGVGQQLPSVTSSAASSASLLNNFPFSFFSFIQLFFVFAIFPLFSLLLVVKVCVFMRWWYFLHSVMLSPRVTLDNQRTDIQLPGHSGLTYSPPSLQVSNPNCHFSQLLRVAIKSLGRQVSWWCGWLRIFSHGTDIFQGRSNRFVEPLSTKHG